MQFGNCKRGASSFLRGLCRMRFTDNGFPIDWLGLIYRRCGVPVLYRNTFLWISPLVEIAAFLPFNKFTVIINSYIIAAPPVVHHLLVFLTVPAK